MVFPIRLKLFHLRGQGYRIVRAFAATDAAALAYIRIHIIVPVINLHDGRVRTAQVADGAFKAARPGPDRLFLTPDSAGVCPD